MKDLFGALARAVILYLAWVVFWQALLAVNSSLVPAVPWFVLPAIIGWWFGSNLALKRQWHAEHVSADPRVIGVFSVATVSLIVSTLILQAAMMNLPPFGPLPAPAMSSALFAATFSIVGPVLAGMVEEISFRGILLPAFLQRTNVATAIAATTALFIAWHLLSPLFGYQYIGYSVAGIALGYLAVTSGSLAACVAVHACVNLIMNAYVTFSGSSPSSYSHLWIMTALVTATVSIVIIILSGMSLWRSFTTVYKVCQRHHGAG